MSQMLLEDAAPAVRAQESAVAPTAESALRAPRWFAPLVLVATLALGAFIYSGFRARANELWWWMGHDRHAHYTYGLNVAMDLKTGDLARLAHDFDGMRVWGPLHPFLEATVQLMAGPDQRLAVLPSMLGWVLTVFCAFLIPRRLLTSGGTAAGLIAGFLVAISPAHRAFATDVMYESLGAGLSLAVIYLYLATVQEQTRRYAILLGLTLSALFLHKYNYWLLVIFGLIAGEFFRQPKAWLQYGLSLCQRDRLPTWFVSELKQPLTWIAFVLAGCAGYVAVTGGGVITVAGVRVSFTEPHNLVHAAYVAVFIRFLFWWRKTGREWSLGLPTGLHEVMLWHGGVVAIWFLLPKRLSYFLWFLSPANNDQQRESVPFMHGLPHYLNAFQEDYLTVPWGAYLAGAMLVLALLAWFRFKPGAAGLFLFLAIATYLTCQHPMLKHRFMHSWVAAVWVLGATGLVFAVQQLAGGIMRELRPWAAGACCAVLIGLHCSALLEPGHAQESGFKPGEPSPLRITDTYLPALADAANPTIVSNVSTRFLWTWTFIEHHRHQKMAAEIKNFPTFRDNPEAATRWLESTRSDALVLIDIRPGSIYDWQTKEYVPLEAFHQALAKQSAWVQTQKWELPEGVSITLWKKNPSPQASTTSLRSVSR